MFSNYCSIELNFKYFYIIFNYYLLLELQLPQKIITSSFYL